MGSVTIRNKASYDRLVADMVVLLQDARKQGARSVNAVLTTAYWKIGRRIVEYEQSGESRAEYGASLLKRLSLDLSGLLGRGFSVDNLESMRLFYLTYPGSEISETASRKSEVERKSATLSRIFNSTAQPTAFPLSWSHYVLLMRRSRSNEARVFYESEAIRGGWSVRQLDRQIDSQFYERTALSRNKAAMLRKGTKAKPEDQVSVEEEIRNPYVLEFLGLKDEYSETDLEEALIRHLETFLLELGGDFTFVARQKRLRVGDEWYRVDLVFFHRRLRCLVLIDLKLGKFSHADAGQMHLYLNFALENWSLAEENPPVGIILCAHKDAAVVKYALDNLRNKIMAAEYRTALPDEKIIAAELDRTRRMLEEHKRLPLHAKVGVNTTRTPRGKRR